jgi:predicted transcriptional regulator
MQKPYRSPQEIADIFGITLPVVQKIITKHRVDRFVCKGLKIHVKDFHKAYTKHYNPSLFTTSLHHE